MEDQVAAYTANNLCQEIVEETPVIDNTNPKVLARVRELEEKEAEFFNRMRIQKRPDGTMWLRAAITPTQADLDSATTGRVETLMLNRGSLFEYLEQRIASGKLRTVQLSDKNYVESEFKRMAGKEVTRPGFVYGYLQNFRVKTYSDRKEIHCDVIIYPNFRAIAEITNGYVTNGFYIKYRSGHPYRWYPSDVSGHIGAYIEDIDKKPADYYQHLATMLKPRFRDELAELSK